MKQFHFVKNKYGQELLMDIGSNHDIHNYFFEPILHQADFYEIIFFNHGNGYLELDNQKINIEDNTIIFISPFQNRKWFIDETKINCHFLFFKDDFLSNFFSDKLFSFKLQYFYNKTNPLFIDIDKIQLLKFQEIFQDIVLELQHFKSDSEHIIRSLLYFILIKLNRFYSAKYMISTETENNVVSIQFKQLLQKEIRNNRNVDFYAHKIGISRITLNKSVKKQFGLTTSQMIDGFLLSELKSLLLYTNKTISEIAILVNYSESNHLTRFFKHQTSLTPTEYRAIYQNGSL